MRHTFATDIYTNAFAKNVRFSRLTGPDARDLGDLRKQIDLGVGAGKEVRDALIEAHNVMVGARPSGRRVRVGAVSTHGGAGGGAAPLYATSVSRPFQSQTTSMPASGDSGCGIAGAGRSSDARCLDEIPCHADILGATTLADSNFPLVGGASPTTQSFNVLPRATNQYKPAFIYFEGRDAANAFAAAPILLTDAKINQFPQLSSAGIAGGVISSAFNVDCPLDARKFDIFGSNNNNQLELTVGNFLGADVDLHAFFVFWGDNVA